MGNDAAIVWLLYLCLDVEAAMTKLWGSSNDASCDVVDTPNQENVFTLIMFPSALDRLFLDEGEVGHFLKL